MELHPTGFFDNSAKSYNFIDVEPIAAAMGAEIVNVQINRLTDDSFAEIEDALFRHKMLLFRNQEMSHSDQEEFTLRFGEFGKDAYTTGLPGHPHIQPVIKEADAKISMIFGSGWHTDSPFMEKPPAISMLRGVEIPPYGGDTIWCNTALAYRSLSRQMQKIIADLHVHMSAAGVVAELEKSARSDADKQSAFQKTDAAAHRQQMIDGWYHPLVRTHPKSSEKALYVDHTYTSGILGMTAAEARGLLSFLKAHVVQPAFSCRMRWEPNTFVIWDNRICIHQAFNDYDGFRREMYRTTVAGEIPG